MSAAVTEGTSLEYRVLDTVQPGDVVVLSAPEPWSAALVGELLALQARARGAVALLVDGAVRDADEIVGLATMCSRQPRPGMRPSST